MTAGTKGEIKGDASACPMMAGKGKAAAACAMGGEKGKCSEHPNCPDAGKCATSAAKPAACTMGAGKDKATAAKPAACPMSAPKATKSAVKAPAKDVAAAKATYICTMCPDVKSDKPGSCPKCGMTLQKK
jgi:Cu+-exporting ATPase